MNDTQYQTLIAIPLLGILMNGAVFISLAGRLDRLMEKFNDLAERVAKIEARLRMGEG